MMKQCNFIILILVFQLNLWADDVTEKASGGFVLVELFTSQGCSSCPPADELLSRLALEPPYKNKIIPLAFHVDYWDQLGWKDPFSHHHWTIRQQRYAQMFQSDSIYTPQMVVDGRYQWVGSDEEKVRYMWDTALKEPDEAVLDVVVSASSENERHLIINVYAKLNDDAIKDGIELFTALYENGMDTVVPHGENSGKTLHEDFVVRQLFKESVTFINGNVYEKSIELDVDKEWDLAKMGTAAYLQRFGTRTILGVAHKPVIPSNQVNRIPIEK